MKRNYLSTDMVRLDKLTYLPVHTDIFCAPTTKVTIPSAGAQKASEMRAGSEKDPKSFLRPYGEESMCTAYKGYSSYPSALAIQWFRAISNALMSFTALELLLEYCQNLAKVKRAAYARKL